MVDFDRLLINFQSESDGLLEESEEDILQLEKEANPQVIDKIFRAVHTIKGNSGLFDLPKIRELAHSMENSLNHYRNHPPDYIPETTIDLYLTTIDRLKTLLSDLKNNEAIDIQDLVQSFQSLNETKANLDPIIAPAISNAPALAPQVNPGKSRNLKISINKKFIKIAEANNHYLALVIVKVKSIAGAQDLKSFVDFFEKRKSEGIVQVSTVSELLPSWQEAGNNDWKIYFLLNCQENPKSALANMEIEYDSLRILYDPKDISIVRKMDPPADKKVEPNQQTSLEALKKDLSNVDNSILGDTKELESTKDSYLKVSLRLIDDLINLAGEAVIARNELIQRIDTTTDSNLLTSAKKIGTLFSKLQEGIMKTRLQELDAVFQKVPRIVRDITRTNGKEAELVSVGGHVELDKTLIDAISDPIMHMVRNSLDHGLETPEERTRAGKSSKGMIRLSATLRGGNVIISIEDDGRGLDREKIQRKIIEKNIMTQEQAESASDEEIFNTVFLPGFSTAEKVTTVSGRGVGMDVVRTNLKKVGGSAEISNRPEGGSIVSLTIPQTLSIVNTLLIRTAGRRYAIPEQNVKELLLIDKTKLSRVETHLIYNLRDHLLPVLDLADFLSIPKSQDYDPKYMAVLKSEKHSFGIILDEIINPEEIVVKSLGSLFSGLSIFSGATIMGDGETV
ncbi:MAG: chemotaxis protein CheA, partial [Leptospira sp.]|nr:chemotaxis protein CheA [Leptospira sp.]